MGRSKSVDGLGIRRETAGSTECSGHVPTGKTLSTARFRQCRTSSNFKEVQMLALILIVLALILFGVGFVIKALWYAAIIAFLLAVISFFMRSASK